MRFIVIVFCLALHGCSPIGAMFAPVVEGVVKGTLRTTDNILHGIFGPADPPSPAVEECLNKLCEQYGPQRFCVVKGKAVDLEPNACMKAGGLLETIKP